MTCPRLTLALGLLAATTLTLDTAHAAEPAIQASTSLSGLSYRVVDLAPDDGIAPQVTFTSGQPMLGMVDYSKPWNQERTSVGGAPFNAEAGGFDGGPGEVSGRITATGQSLTLSTQADQIVNPTVMAKVAQQLQDNPYLNPGLYSAGGTIYTTLPGMRWELTPHTALVIEGEISAELALQLGDIDRSQLTPYIDGQGRTMSFYVQASSGISLVSDEWMKDPFGNGPRSSIHASFDREINWGPEGDRDQWRSDSRPESGFFTISLANDTGQRLAGNFYQESHLNTWAQLSDPRFSPTVPEPSTYLLFALGVSLLPLARRRAAWRS